MKIETFPAIIGLELTLACNLRCKHCASYAGQQRKDELSTEEMLSVCKQFSDLLVQEVDLTGGEPLLRPDWFKIATYIRELNIPVRMVSNGLLLRSYGSTTPLLAAQLEKSYDQAHGRADS